MFGLSADEPLGNRGWVDNMDRSGWYTTSITDVWGNQVEIVYYGASENPNYPEAIKEIRIKGKLESAWRTVIRTTLWTGAGVAPALQGTLRHLEALVAHAQWARYTFNYEEREVNSWQYTPTFQDIWETDMVPYLISVDLPEVADPDPDRRKVSYAYEVFERSVPLLSRLTYPNGGVSEYSSGYFVGQRWDPCPDVHAWEPGTPAPWEACVPWYSQRHDSGVEMRTLYPDGPGEGKPRAAWTWFRDFTGQFCCATDSNVFRLTQPNGLVTESEMAGHPTGDCGDGPSQCAAGLEGHERARVVKTIDGDPYRRESILYDTQPSCDGYDRVRRATEILEQRRVTEFLDDDGSCFGLSPPAGQSKSITQSNYWRAPSNQWRVQHTTGDYLRSARLTYRNYEDEPSECRAENHVLGAYDTSFTLQDGQRVERLRTVDDCTGAVTHQQARDEFIDDSCLDPVTEYNNCLATYPQHPEICTDVPDPGDWVDWAACHPTGDDTADVERSFEYREDGNLSTATANGGDGYADGTAIADFTVTYEEWAYGVPTRMQITGLDYPSKQIQVDPSGTTTSSTSPNALTSTYT